MDCVLEMKGISKYFAGVRANRRVDFSVRKGEVHALLGENGAGKTTLMNILYGLYAPTEGEIYISGEKKSIPSPRAAIDLGIGMVHQHFMLVPTLTVLENVILGMPSENPLRLQLRPAEKKLVALSAKYHLDIDPNAKAGDLSVGQQQRVEIVKAIYRGAKLLILDEPTAVLTPQEVDELFSIIRALIAEGSTVIYISHKLQEVMTICDRVTVLRHGEVVGTKEVADISKKELAEMMVGRDFAAECCKAPASGTPEEILSLRDVACVSVRGAVSLKGISFSIHAGEILGICGVDGNGQSELCDAIAGLLPIRQGQMLIKGKDMTKADPLAILKQNVSNIPADRHKTGTVLGMDLVENVLLMNYWKEGFTKGPILQWDYADRYTQRLIEDYQVKATSSHELMKTLSGGNQQKVVLGRELLREPTLLLAAHPTRGLDIGATKYVQENILKARERGAAILLVSTELDELQLLSDGIAVLYEGEIMGIVPPETEVYKLGLMMAGTRLEALD